MSITPETRALLVADARRAINLLGLDSDRESALADMVVTNMEGSIISIATNSRMYGALLGKASVVQEIIEDQFTAEELRDRLAYYQGRIKGVQS